MPRLLRGSFGAAVGLFFGSAACSALESTPLAAVLAQSLLTLAGVALGAGYPPALSGPSDRLFAAAGAWARGPAGRRALAAALGGGAAAVFLAGLGPRVRLDPFSAGALPSLVFYACLGAGLGWPGRLPKSILTLVLSGVPAALLAGVFTYDRLCNYGKVDSCAAVPGFGWYLWSGLSFLALLTGGLAVLPIHFLAPALPPLAFARLCFPQGERHWPWALGCAAVFLALARPGLERTVFANVYQCCIPAAALGYALGLADERRRGEGAGAFAK